MGQTFVPLHGTSGINSVTNFTTSAGLNASLYSLQYQVSVPIFGGNRPYAVPTNSLVPTGAQNVYRSNSPTAPAGATYSSSGSLSTFVTPSGAVVSASGKLISGPPNK
jgi:hypothetical protein